jgi:biotin synthase
MGETNDDIVQMGFSLRSMDIESIPINFLLTIPGTPLQSMMPIDANHGLKVLCLMRLLNPTKEVRVAAGRETHLRGQQGKSAVRRQLAVCGWLPDHASQAAKDVRDWIEAAGYRVEI